VNKLQRAAAEMARLSKEIADNGGIRATIENEEKSEKYSQLQNAYWDLKLAIDHIMFKWAREHFHAEWMN
jgi:hypothetical protein